MARRSVLSQVAALGEDALGRLAQNPAATRMLQGAMELKERVDDLAKRVRSLESLDERLDAVEQRLDRLESRGGRELEGGADEAGAAGATDPDPSSTAATTTKSSGA